MTEPLDEAAAVAVFSALVEPTRRSLLDTLARQGPATVSELADRLPITRQAVAKHLAQLVDAGLVVAGEPQGRRVPYHLRPQPMLAALAWLRALANQWDDRLDALTGHLGAGQPADPARAHAERDGADLGDPGHDRSPPELHSIQARRQRP